LRRLTSRTSPARLSRRAVFHVDGRSFGAVVVSDKDGYTAEATVARALARAVDLTPPRPTRARGMDADVAEAT